MNVLMHKQHLSFQVVTKQAVSEKKDKIMIIYYNYPGVTRPSVTPKMTFFSLFISKLTKVVV